MKEEREAGEMTETAVTKKRKKETPRSTYFDALLAFAKEHGNGDVMLVRGIDRQRDDDVIPDDDEEDNLTEEEVKTLRFLVINDSRDKAIQHGVDFASCGQVRGHEHTRNQTHLFFLYAEKERK